MKTENKEFLKCRALEAILRKSHLLCGLEMHSIEFHDTAPEMTLNLKLGCKQLIYLIMEDFSVERIENLESELGKDGDLPYFWVDVDSLGDYTDYHILLLHEKGVAIALFLQREDGDISLRIPREYDPGDVNDLLLAKEKIPDDFCWEYME
jgi:hypothetical protein